MRKTLGVYEHPSGSGIYWIEWHDHQGKRHREKVGPKGAAVTLYRKRKTDALLQKKLPELNRKRITFRELAEDALEYSRIHKRSYPSDHIRMKCWKEWFGDRDPASITPQEIERRLSSMSDRKPATLNRYRALLSLVYRLGMQNGKVSANPARLVRQRQENNLRHRYLTAEEEKKLRGAITEMYPERVRDFDFALHPGLRWSEQYGLGYANIDFRGWILTVSRSKHGRERHVPLNSVAISALPGGTEKHVFEPTSPRSWFGHAVKDAGIPHFTWHDLRHTFASRLVMAGVDLATVKELMGHRTITTTMRYAHLAPAHEARAVRKLETFEEPTATRTATELAYSA